MACTIPNRRAAIGAWLRALPAASRIGLEATGRYHELLADLAHGLGFAVFVLNPKDTRHYARAVGMRAKTDRVDAALIARLLAHEHAHLRPYTPAGAEQRRIDRLMKRRMQLTKFRGALKQSLQDLTGLSPQIKGLMTKLDSLIDALDIQLAALNDACPTRAQAQARLQTIVGVGPLVGTGLANALERIPFNSADAFVAFTGLDPRPRDSGHKVGRRRLSKRGPSELRRLLFNAAMSASRTKTWKPIYDHYRSRGLPTTAALVVIARKIARTAWSIYHHQTTFNPDRLTQALT
jgi:transposase